ncbi:MAG: hypothetical protein MZV65_22080 [Chromatiales bacterium]|nr:hypothetical protein [Chromatiales bacterium]
MAASPACWNWPPTWSCPPAWAIRHLIPVAARFVESVQDARFGFRDTLDLGSRRICPSAACRGAPLRAAGPRRAPSARHPGAVAGGPDRRRWGLRRDPRRSLAQSGQSRHRADPGHRACCPDPLELDDAHPWIPGCHELAEPDHALGLIRTRSQRGAHHPGAGRRGTGRALRACRGRRLQSAGRGRVQTR